MLVARIKIAALTLFAAGVLVAVSVLSHTLTAAPQAESSPPKHEAARKPDAKPIAVKVVKPKRGGIVLLIGCPAEVIAAQQQHVAPLIAGFINEVRVTVGDRVKKGQVLIVLDAPDVAKKVAEATAALEMAQAQVEEAKACVDASEAEKEAAEAGVSKAEADQNAAQAELLEAEGQLKRYEGLLKARSIQEEMVVPWRHKVDAARARIQASKAAIAAARAEVKIKLSNRARARAALKVAEARTKTAQVAKEWASNREKYTQLKAAFDGVVTRRTIGPGNVVQPSDSRLLRPLLTVQTLDQLRIVSRVPDGYARYIERGLPVDLKMSDLPGIRITGQKIARFSPTLDDTEHARTMLVEIDFDNTQEHRLLAGMLGEVTIHLKKPSPDALVIPSSCVVTVGGKRCVYVVRDGKAHRTPVDVNDDDGKNAVIIKGIQVSDLVITNNLGELSEGTPVEIKKMP